MGVDGPLGSGRALRLDPYALPRATTRATQGRWAGSPDRANRGARRAPPRGARIRLKVGVPVEEFRGVTMRTLPPEGEEPAVVAVMLEHRDEGLTVPLFVGQAVTFRMEVLGRVLGLPLLVVESDGVLREPLAGLAGCWSASPRRGAGDARCCASAGHRSCSVGSRSSGPRAARRRGKRSSRAADLESPPDRRIQQRRANKSGRRRGWRETSSGIKSGSSIAMARSARRCAANAVSPNANTSPRRCTREIPASPNSTTAAAATRQRLPGARADAVDLSRPASSLSWCA